MSESKEIEIVAEFYAASGKAEALQEILTGLIVPTRSEAGNIRYDLHVDVSDPEHFFFIERFTDIAAIDLHNSTTYIQSLGTKLEGLVASPPKVTRMRQISFR